MINLNDLDSIPIYNPNLDDQPIVVRARQLGESLHTWLLDSKRDFVNAQIYEYILSRDDSDSYMLTDNISIFKQDLLNKIEHHNASNVRFHVIVNSEDGNAYDVVLNYKTDIDSVNILIGNMLEFKGSAEMKDEIQGSDNTKDKLVMWNLEKITLVSNKDKDTITLIIGSSNMFKGYITSIINYKDHNVPYLNGDCIFIILNEVTKLRLDPETVKRTILNDKYISKDNGGSIITDRLLPAIANIYKVNILLINIDTNPPIVKLTGRQSENNLNTIMIVRKGSCIGLIEKEDVLNNNLLVEDVATDNKTNHAYYDLETYSTNKGSTVYSLALIWIDGKRHVLLHHDKDILYNHIVDKLFMNLSKECIEPTNVYLHAWNGSGFDHRFIIHILSSKFRVYNIIKNNNRILSAILKCGNLYLYLRDPMKMFQGALNEVSNSFKLDINKLSIDHDEIQRWAINNKLDEYINNNKNALIEYVTRDVELLKLLTTNIMKVYELSNINYWRPITRNAAATDYWRHTLTILQKKSLSYITVAYGGCLTFGSSNGPISVSIEHVKSNAIGGRTQAISGIYDNVMMVDFISMYPTCCIQELYPGGESIPVTEYVSNVLGLYIVNIVSQNIPCVIPYRSNPNETYNWEYTGAFTKILTHRDIECLIENDATYTILGGCIWQDSQSYFDKYMTEMFNKRAECKTKTDALSIQLGEHYKAMANTLTGALFQKLKRETIKIFANEQQLIEYLKINAKSVELRVTENIGDNQIMAYLALRDNLKHDISNDDIAKDFLSTKPILLTMFIYSYARSRLWRLWKLIESSNAGKIVLCDTDSLAIVKSYTNTHIYDIIKPIVGSDIGQLKIEIDDASMVVVRPKFYGLKHEDKIKLRAKGISNRVPCMMYNTLDEANTAMNFNMIDGVGCMSKSDNRYWDNRRLLYEHYMKCYSHRGYTYDDMVMLYNGKIMCFIDFYYDRKDKMFCKSYVPRIIKCDKLNKILVSYIDDKTIDETMY